MSVLGRFRPPLPCELDRYVAVFFDRYLALGCLLSIR